MKEVNGLLPSLVTLTLDSVTGPHPFPLRSSVPHYANEAELD